MNLAGHEEQRERVDELSRRLRELSDRARSLYREKGEERPLDPESERFLRELG